MGKYFIKTPWWLKKIYPRRLWSMPATEKNIYLTFDDGPQPLVTTFVLEELKKYNAKATFFCIGDNIKKNPSLFKKIINEGHAIGNHTCNHLNGWKANTDSYIENIKLCEDAIEKHSDSNLKSKLFRPPYGKLRKSQSRAIRKLGYKIIMWDVLSADFDTSITKEKCLQNVLDYVEPGSIIVFHDSIKAFKNLEYVLPKTLAFLNKNNFNCEVL